MTRSARAPHQAWVEAAVAATLAIGILPSWTALSRTLATALPALGRYVGPVNPIKALAPLLLYYVWREHERVPTWISRVLIGAFVLGSVFTVAASWRCGWLAAPLREWAAMALGTLAATAFLVLPPRRALQVALGWAIALYGLAALDLAWPASIDWLYANIFDPDSRTHDLVATGHRLLTGVFSSQSMAKLLAWMPWVLLLAWARVEPKANAPEDKRTARLVTLGLIAAGAVYHGAILATSQRGPFLGALAGWAAFALHQGWRVGNRRVAGWALGALLLAGVTTAVVVPSDLLKLRVQSLVGVYTDSSHYSKTARFNLDHRRAMNRLSWWVIGRYPMGHACLEENWYYDFGAWPPGHAHNMMLQQFRERGWLWGATHLALWLTALFGALRARTLAGSALIGGIVTTLVFGLADHPWFVINHAMVLGVLLVGGLMLLGPRPSVLDRLRNLWKSW